MAFFRLAHRQKSIVALHGARIPGQFAEACDAEDVAGNAKVREKKVRRGDDLPQYGARTQQPYAEGRVRRASRAQPIHPFHDLFLDPRRHRGLRVVLVHHGDVVKVVRLLLHHRAHAVIHHPCCTCRMGTDDSAVVDADAKVHGLDNLRVVDASIMPEIVSGNLNAPVIMMAEKLSDTIRGRTPLEPTPLPYYDPRISSSGAEPSASATRRSR